MLKQKKVFAVLIGSILSIAFLVFGFQIFSGVFTRASDTEPRDVVISDITKNSARVSWSTGIETQGVIEYGTTPTALNFFAPETTRTKSHQVDLTLLSPNTSYYFQIRIGDKKYDNGGVPWTFTTKSTDETVAPTTAPTVNLENNTIDRLTNLTSTPTGTLKRNPRLRGSTEIEVEKTSDVQGCNETDCQKIKDLLGKGCTSQDYIKCMLKSISTSPTPTTILTPSPSVTPTPTNTVTPTPTS